MDENKTKVKCKPQIKCPICDKTFTKTEDAYDCMIKHINNNIDSNKTNT
jgi:hypothetical protein